MNSQERMDQEAFVAGLKDNISGALYDYIGSDEAGKELALQALGLTAADVVNLGAGDVESILSLLDKQNIHFGRSAFVSLDTILRGLTQQGEPGVNGSDPLNYTLEDLALKTVLIDIFTGSLNKFSEGTLLELSMYALAKTASTYGVELNNTKLNFDDLRGLTQIIDPDLNGSDPLNIIAHLKNNHYVVVTNIAADDKVTYVEHNRGQNGYTWTVSRQDFENSWTGYAIVRGKIGTVPEGDCPILPESIAAKKISDDTAMRIKGSCLPFLFPLLGAIFGMITGVATAVVGAISAIVTGISAILGPIITGIGQMIAGISGFMTGIGAQLFSAIQFVGTSLLPNIGGFFGGIGSWLGGVGSAIFGPSGLGGVISATGFNLSGLGAAICKTVALTALSIGVSKGLESLGVNSTISGLLSAFVTGGVGGFISGHTILSALTGGIQGVAIQGINALAPKLGIDPMLGNVIGMTAGAFIGAVGNNISPDTGLFNLDGFSVSIGEKIMPSVTSELAYYGVIKAGELLGVDPRISYLAGIGIRSSLQAGLTDGFKPDVLWNGVTDGLLRGVTSLSINFAGEAMGVPPLATALAANAIAGALTGVFRYNGDVVKGVYESMSKSLLNVVTLGGSGNDPWSQAVYISKVLDFSKIVQEKGIVTALDTYTTAIFQQYAVDLIVKQGGIASFITGQSKLTKLPDGRDSIEVTIGDKTKINLDPTSDNLIGREYYDPQQKATIKEYASSDPNVKGFGYDQFGRFGLVNGTIVMIKDGASGTTTAEGKVVNGYIESWKVTQPDAPKALIIKPNSATEPVIVDPGKETPTQGTLTDEDGSFEAVYKQGKLVDFKINDPSKIDADTTPISPEEQAKPPLSADDQRRVDYRDYLKQKIRDGTVDATTITNADRLIDQASSNDTIPNISLFYNVQDLINTTGNTGSVQWRYKVSQKVGYSLDTPDPKGAKSSVSLDPVTMDSMSFSSSWNLPIPWTQIRLSGVGSSGLAISDGMDAQYGFELSIGNPVVQGQYAPLAKYTFAGGIANDPQLGDSIRVTLDVDNYTSVPSLVLPYQQSNFNRTSYTFTFKRGQSKEEIRQSLESMVTNPNMPTVPQYIPGVMTTLYDAIDKGGDTSGLLSQVGQIVTTVNH